MDSSNKVTFYNMGKNNQSMTLHSSKGKEFEQVIIFADDFENVEQSEETLNLLYVAITRAKQKLIILTNGYNTNLMLFLKAKFEKAKIKGNKVLESITFKKED